MFLAETATWNSADSSMVIFSSIIAAIIILVMIIAYWKVFVKAGESGWKSIIPIYNTYTLFRIAGRNGWWILAMLVPLINIIVLITISIDLAKHFGKSGMFGFFGLFLFSIIGYLMLGFGDAKYLGPKHD